MVDHSFLSHLPSSGWNVLFCSLWRQCAWYPACQGGVRWFLQDLVRRAGSHAQRFLLFPWRLCLCLPPHYRLSFNLPAAGSRGVAEGWREALWKKKWIPRPRVGVTNDLWCVPFLLQYTRNWQGYFGCSLHPLPHLWELPAIAFPSSGCQQCREFCKTLPARLGAATARD